MKITGTSSYIIVEFDKKTVRIQGERLVNGFLAYSDTINNWEPPYDHLIIDCHTKREIINAVLNESKSSLFKIEFD
jgi:hypothetical protein